MKKKKKKRKPAKGVYPDIINPKRYSSIIHYSHSVRRIVRIDTVIQYSRSPSVRQKWQVSKRARHFVIPWQPETPLRSPPRLSNPSSPVAAPPPLSSHHQGSRSSRLVFTFLRATCQLVPTLTLGCYAHFEQLETRHGTCNWIPVFTFKSILDELCVAHVRLPMHPLPPSSHLTAAIPFPFRVSFRSRSSPNYVSVSEDRFLFRYPTLPARGEIESAFERRKRHEAAK